MVLEVTFGITWFNLLFIKKELNLREEEWLEKKSHTETFTLFSLKSHEHQTCPGLHYRKDTWVLNFMVS